VLDFFDGNVHGENVAVDPLGRLLVAASTERDGRLDLDSPACASGVRAAWTSSWLVSSCSTACSSSRSSARAGACRPGQTWRPAPRADQVRAGSSRRCTAKGESRSRSLPQHPRACRVASVGSCSRGHSVVGAGTRRVPRLWPFACHCGRVREDARRTYGWEQSV
jgi:hypothetical protein